MASCWLGVLDSSDPAIKKRLLLKGTLIENPQSTRTQTNNWPLVEKSLPKKTSRLGEHFFFIHSDLPGFLDSLKRSFRKWKSMVGWKMKLGPSSAAMLVSNLRYCWWKKPQTITWDVSNLANNGINYSSSSGDCRISEPSTVCSMISSWMEPKKRWFVIIEFFSFSKSLLQVNHVGLLLLRGMPIVVGDHIRI